MSDSQRDTLDRLPVSTSYGELRGLHVAMARVEQKLEGFADIFTKYTALEERVRALELKGAGVASKFAMAGWGLNALFAILLAVAAARKWFL